MSYRANGEFIFTGATVKSQLEKGIDYESGILEVKNRTVIP